MDERLDGWIQATGLLDSSDIALFKLPWAN